MTDASDKPSQAEGEDPDRPASGTGSEATDKPSQAEGEDPSPQSGESPDDADAGAKPSDG